MDEQQAHDASYISLFTFKSSAWTWKNKLDISIFPKSNYAAKFFVTVTELCHLHAPFPNLHRPLKSLLNSLLSHLSST